MANLRGLTLLQTIQQERDRQDAKWGEQNHHPLYWLGILTEELGEVAKASIEADWSNYATELIQLAAVAVAALESLDRNGEPK